MDIELVFRQMAATHKAASPQLAKTSLMILFSLSIVGLNPTQNIYAATAATTVSQTPEAAKITINEILSGEDFHQIKKVSVPKLTTDWDWSWDWDDIEKDKEPEPLSDFAIAIAPFIEAIIWSIVIALLLFATFRYRHWLLALGKRTSSKAKPDSQPKTIFGLDITAESLPDDIPTTVMAHWQNQQHREAIGLLYRALLNQLIHHYQVPIINGDTEGDCITKAKPLSNSQLTHYLMDLTNIWLQLAYAHQLPPESAVKDLCQRWGRFNTGAVNV